MAVIKIKPRWYIALLACLALLFCSLISCRTAPPAIILFNVTPSEINLGQSTTLKWDIKDAASVTIDQGIGEVAAAGSVKLSPTKTIAYTLTAANAGGTVSKSLVVYVNPPLPPPVDTTPPVIKDVSASSETEMGAVITWVTNEPGSSQVEYGQTTEYGLTVTSDELATAHSLTLSSLEPNTEYHYRVKSKDKADNEASSKDYSFATAAPKSAYTLELQSLEWGRRGDISFGSSVIPGIQYLFVKGTMRNTSRGSLKGVICTMNCWSGDTLVKYEIYVHRSPTLPGQFFNFDIQTDDDTTVDNVTVDFADSLGREIVVTQKSK
jgi:hypothetical protein